MDDLKSKLLNLIHKQGHSKIPIVGSKTEDPFHYENEYPCPPKEVKVVKESERPSDQEILESIDSKYFTVEEKFDACRYELSKISGEVHIDFIQTELGKLHQQHLVVSNQVLQMILEKQSACQEEFKRVVEVQENVDEVLTVVRSGRQNLGIATRNFTTASLGILANYRKRTLVQQLLRFLSALRTLQRTESRLQELLNDGDFPGAISLHHEALGVASQYEHFNCVKALTAKLHDTNVMAEQHLDVALGKICYDFDEDVYRKLQTAYYLLGKTPTVMDQLHMHFTSAVHNHAFQSVSMFADPLPDTKEYAQLCKFVKDENLIPCLLSLCKRMWYIVLSYNKIVQWHENNTQLPGYIDSSYSEHCDTINQKLKSGLTRLWNDIQSRVSLLVLAADLSNYKFDDFLQVLSILHRLSQIGEELCGSESEELASSVKTQSSNYFKLYHLARLDDLRVFLENEVWTLCPVRSDFTLLYLQEFRGLRCIVEQCAGILSRHDSSLDGSSVGAGSFFSRFPEPHQSTPFDTNFQVDTRDEEILASIPDDPSGYFSEESDDENEMRNSKDDEKRKKKNGPLLTNTTLTVLRHCGKYLQMSRLLKSIAADVVTALCQLFEYYLYTVYYFFTADTASNLCANITSIKLLAALKRIKDSIIQIDETEEASQKITEAEISPVVDLTNPGSLYGLSERVVAVESLVFLSQQYTFLRQYLELLLKSQSSTTHHLDQFYSQTISVSKDVRKPVYSCVALRAIDGNKTVSMMSKVNWEVKEVMSQHSPYVDAILRELQVFSMRFEEVEKHLHIPDEVKNCLWESIAHRLSLIFVEGFSTAKKFSNAGKALMQLDYTQLVSKLEKLCSLRPIPHREYVEVYVKAYYKQEEELENWIREHNEYTYKQLMSLVTCVCQTKKIRQRLIALIEDMERSGIR